uniref:Uncharacterized protein n=1 Tax=Soybean thrips sobemo-like virus 1 TaxID=2800867 RepID=A0A7T8G210_9VIRU|nr:hypothetical protein [Soybean thrips sobemo-like virus 1]
MVAVYDQGKALAGMASAVESMLKSQRAMQDTINDFSGKIVNAFEEHKELTGKLVRDSHGFLYKYVNEWKLDAHQHRDALNNHEKQLAQQIYGPFYGLYGHVSLLTLLLILTLTSVLLGYIGIPIVVKMLTVIWSYVIKTKCVIRKALNWPWNKLRSAWNWYWNYREWYRERVVQMRAEIAALEKAERQAYEKNRVCPPLPETRKPFSPLQDGRLKKNQCLIGAGRVQKQGSKRTLAVTIVGCGFRLGDRVVFPEHILPVEYDYVTITAGDMDVCSEHHSTEVTLDGNDVASVSVGEDQLSMLGLSNTQICATPDSTVKAVMVGADLTGDNPRIVRTFGDSWMHNDVWGRVNYSGSTVNGCSGGLYFVGDKALAMHTDGGADGEPNHGLAVSLIEARLATRKSKRKEGKEGYDWLLGKGKVHSLYFENSGDPEYVYVHARGMYHEIPRHILYQYGYELEEDYMDRDDEDRDNTKRRRKHRAVLRGPKHARSDSGGEEWNADDGGYDEDELDDEKISVRGNKKLSHRQSRAMAQRMGEDPHFYDYADRMDHLLTDYSGLTREGKIQEGKKTQEALDEAQAKLRQLKADPYCDATADNLNVQQPQGEPELELEIQGKMVKRLKRRVAKSPEETAAAQATNSDGATASAVSRTLNQIAALNNMRNSIQKLHSSYVRFATEEDKPRIQALLSELEISIKQIAERVTECREALGSSSAKSSTWPCPDPVETDPSRARTSRGSTPHD